MNRRIYMAIGVTNEFEEMKVGMGLAPLPQHPLEIKSMLENAPVVQKSEQGNVKPVANPNILDDAVTTGGTLRHYYYKDPEATPKSDISYGADVLGKATMELFGALGSKADEPDVATPENPQLAMATPAQKYTAPFGL